MTARVTLPDRRVPFGVAWTMATVLEGVWRVTNRAGAPPITRSMLRLAGQPFDVCVARARARAQLGYVARMTVAAGMDELAASARTT